MEEGVGVAVVVVGVDTGVLEAGGTSVDSK